MQSRRQMIALRRIEQQQRQYPMIPSDIMQQLAEADPTLEKVYLRWLANLYARHRLPLTDLPRVRLSLGKFHNAKRAKWLPVAHRDILQFENVLYLYYLTAVMDQWMRPKQSRRPNLSWTSTLEWRHCTSDSCLANLRCNANIGKTIDVIIGITGGWLTWSVARESDDTIKWLRRGYARTGLMKPIIKAVREVLDVYLRDEQPPQVEIRGFDDKRIKLYQSWSDWRFPGYESELFGEGIIFKQPRPCYP